ncbi:GNAT family N-acetyltransferase [Streptomyces sp. NPDC007088]|uniref:GNAT family N-acetyltransferase n=1 Tax=Streptomyces sp. NPDC007088 TaxID=3364773 RepID=UPI0036A9DF6B
MEQKAAAYARADLEDPEDQEDGAEVAPVVLVPPAVEHAEAMAGVLADPALYAFTGGSPPDVAALRARYARQAAGSPDPSVTWVNLLIVAEEGEFAGYVQATVTEAGRRAELAWVVGTAWQGRGLARRAVGALAHRLALGGVRELVAHVHPRHLASRSVARAAGLTPTLLMVDGEQRWEGRVAP